MIQEAQCIFVIKLGSSILHSVEPALYHDDADRRLKVVNTNAVHWDGRDRFYRKPEKRSPGLLLMSFSAIELQRMHQHLDLHVEEAIEWTR